jgi:hypothetical protein
MARTLMLKDVRWQWCLPGIALILACLLPSGDIVASPLELFHPPMWMAPLAWPLIALGFLIIGAGFSEWLRRNSALIVLAGSSASILLELVMSEFPGNIAIYSYWFGTDLGGRVLVDFELNVLAFLFVPLDIVMMIGSLLVLWISKFRPESNACGS